MKSSNGRSWLGIVLIILGTIFLLKNLQIFPYEIQRLVFSWQSILLVLGVIIISKSRDNFMGILFIVIGGISLMLKIFHYSFRDFFYEYWPFLLIALGLYIIYRRKDFSQSHHHQSELTDGEETPVNVTPGSDEDFLDETAVFSSANRRIKSKNFRGGKITAIFGGVDLDLYDAQLADGEHILDTVCIFGGIDVLVPKDWQVIVKTTAIFGGIDDQRRQEVGTVFQEGKVLTIKGLALFGGGDIKN